ncbi:helix-turn-helix domain-containing protein, partial [Rhodospirillum rubrum]
MKTSVPDTSRAERAGGSGQVGALLRATRLRVGEPIERVAESLRIRQGYLHAIEEGRYQDLPGAAYAVGFVRAYADHLGLHAEEVVRRFKDETQSMVPAATLEFPAPTGEGGVPAGALVAVALILAACAYGAWYWVSSAEKPVAELIPDIPDRLAALVGRSPSLPPG